MKTLYRRGYPPPKRQISRPNELFQRSYKKLLSFNIIERLFLYTTTGLAPGAHTGILQYCTIETGRAGRGNEREREFTFPGEFPFTFFTGVFTIFHGSHWRNQGN